MMDKLSKMLFTNLEMTILALTIMKEKGMEEELETAIRNDPSGWIGLVDHMIECDNYIIYHGYNNNWNFHKKEDLTKDVLELINLHWKGTEKYTKI